MSFSLAPPAGHEALTAERAARTANRLRLGILISGRGSNMEALLAEIAARRLSAEAAVVISDVPDAAGLARAAARGVETLTLDPAAFADRTQFQAAMAAELADRQVDLICLAGFMRLVKAPLLERFAGRILNVHPSLLPAFAGLNAQSQALAYGVQVTGCTIHFVDAGMDTGPIVLQRAVPVLTGDTVETLSERILTIEHQLYPQAVQLIAEKRLAVSGRRVEILPCRG